jgi:DNA-binding LytR/AlgR family response regulator
MERIAAATPPAHLQWLRVPYGDGIRMLPVDEVVYFQARDKYTAVITPAGEALIGTSIRDLTTALDPQRFWQINRGTIVHITWIDKVSRSLTGRGVIRLKSRPETLTISRSYLHRFKQM